MTTRGGDQKSLIIGDSHSKRWEGASPAITVAIATHERSGFLAELFDHLEHQALSADDFEVVVCDDGSSDTTWDVLVEETLANRLRIRVIRLAESGGGPARARNQAVALGRAELVAFTDDDCLPSEWWLKEVIGAFDRGADIVQGKVWVRASDEMTADPWDKTLRVTAATPWFEAANIAYRRALFDRVGGFDESDGVSRRPGGLAFGEDCLLGARAVEAGGVRTFADESVVFHRFLAGQYVDYLEGRRRLVGFPALARRSHLVREQLVGGIFLTRQTAAFDLALVGSTLAVLRRNPRWLVVWVWYLWVIWPDAGRRRNPLPFSRGRRILQLAYGDAVGLAWLVRGSRRHGRLVL